MAVRFKRPLFLCMPSVARQMHRLGKSFWLLDHDRRFESTPNFRFFDLFKPYFFEGNYDAIFMDPPFSNISIDDLTSSVHTLNGFQQTRNLFLCHMLDQEATLLSKFSSFNLCRYSGHLCYDTVKIETQRRIFLFGSKQFLKYDS